MFYDRKVLFGIGIGILISVSLFIIFKPNTIMSDSQVEMRAREMGMNYPSEIKVLDIKGEKK